MVSSGFLLVFLILLSLVRVLKESLGSEETLYYGRVEVGAGIRNIGSEI